MTLLKKLLPIASIAAAAAVVAPVVTSCGAGSMTFDPTIEPDVTGWKKSIKDQQDMAQAEIEYSAAIKDDINVFKNDFRFGASFVSKFIEIQEKMGVPTSYNPEFIWDFARCTLSNVSLGESGGMNTITFKNTINFEITFKTHNTTQPNSNLIYKTKVSLETDAKNVPYFITTNFDFNLTTIPLFSLYFGEYFYEDPEMETNPGYKFKSIIGDWHVNSRFSYKQEKYNYDTEKYIETIEDSSDQWAVNKDNIVNIERFDFANAESDEFIMFLYSWPSYFFLGTEVVDSGK